MSSEKKQRRFHPGLVALWYWCVPALFYAYFMQQRIPRMTNVFYTLIGFYVLSALFVLLKAFGIVGKGKQPQSPVSATKQVK